MGDGGLVGGKEGVGKKGKELEDKGEEGRKGKDGRGKRVFGMVKDVKVVLGKGGGREDIEREDGEGGMWKKKCIFWELGYWELLEVGEGMEVMEVSKKVWVKVVGLVGV